MRAKVLSFILVLVLVYGGLRLVEWFTRQELTRVIEPSTQEAAVLIWQPQLLSGNGRCHVRLLDAKGKVVASADLGTQSSAFEALQRLGQLGFDGVEVTVADLQTGEFFRRFTFQDDQLVPKY